MIIVGIRIIPTQWEEHIWLHLFICTVLSADWCCRFTKQSSFLTCLGISTRRVYDDYRCERETMLSATNNLTRRCPQNRSTKHIHIASQSCRYGAQAKKKGWNSNIPYYVVGYHYHKHNSSWRFRGYLHKWCCGLFIIQRVSRTSERGLTYA